MTALVQRKLPGTPTPREQLVAEWKDLHHRNLKRSVVAHVRVGWLAPKKKPVTPVKP
jgi:hypothetical protein